MAKSSDGAGRGSYSFPKAPKGAPPIVIEAYRKRVGGIREGLTPKDRRMLMAGVKRGELFYGEDTYGYKYWSPIVRTAGGKRVPPA